ncbi:MAG TPA: lysophospholipase [Oscillospiraceae bacterium]|nr:lysophospholipase [Oscillospiraceae bacterium]
MAATREFTFDSSTGKNKIYACEWAPETAPRAVLQISHGVLEHIGRYDALARFFTAHGFLVVGNDHLGHGRSAASPEELGFFAEKDGWEHLVRDMRALTEMTQRNCGALPYFLFGHSMGSLLVHTYLIRYQTGLTGAILSAMGRQSAMRILTGRAAVQGEIKKHGTHFRSETLNKICFSPYSKAFRPARTPSDWISSDEAVVDAYIADPFTRFVPTAGLFSDMAQGAAYVQKKSNLRRMNKKTPVLFYAGAKDPVSGAGKGVTAAYESFRAAGMEDVTLKLYENGRHEMHNEVCRETVLGDVLSWMESKM